LTGVVVVPYRGGEGQDALQDTDPDPGRGVAAVLFEVELAFESMMFVPNALRGVKIGVGRSATPPPTGAFFGARL
jgi:hypothetical protein